eukprot:g50408.t1
MMTNLPGGNLSPKALTPLLQKTKLHSTKLWPRPDYQHKNSLRQKELPKNCKGFVAKGALKAKGHFFHIEHFCCDICNTRLEPTGFGFYKEKFYCPKCFTGLSAPAQPKPTGVEKLRQGPKKATPSLQQICGGCHKPVVGELLTLDKTPYHANCIKCVQCGLSLRSDGEPAIYKYHALIHCQACALANLDAEASAHTCYTCKQAVAKGSLDSLTALGRAFHKNCFVCNVDKHKIEGNYWVGEGKQRLIYCEEHYQKTSKHRCGKCQRMIEDEYVTVEGVDMHKNCWRCYACQKVIREDTARSARGLHFCLGCYAKIPADGSGININGVWIPADAKLLQAQRRIRGYDQYDMPEGAVDPKDSPCYPLEVCRLPYGVCPKEIDFRRREQYLDHEVFKSLFGVDMATFLKYPLWHRLMLKKQHGLF